MSELIQEGMATGGPRAAFERFLRMVAGDANWDSLDPTERDRLLASAGTYFEVEVGRFDDFVPGDEVLSAIAAAVEILVSEDSLPAFGQAARRLAARLGSEITSTPGTHFPYLDYPDELARVVKERVRQTVA